MGTTDALTDHDKHWLDLFARLADMFVADRASVRRPLRVTHSLRPQNQMVVKHLPSALANAGPVAASVCASLTALQGVLHWRQNTNYSDPQFLRGYAYCELLGPDGHWHNDAVALGLLLLGPELTYPAHVHPATEIYVVLSGLAHWQQDDGPWRARPSGSVIEHASMEPHAMRTNAEPLLAAYLWRDHLHDPARLVESAGPLSGGSLQ